MKNLAILLVFFTLFYSCNSNKTALKNNNSETQNSIKNDTIRIANDELEYEIIIFETGFESWLATQPPKGHYGINYLENKNRLFVVEYNNRVQQDRTRQLYEQEINYDPYLHYGLEVNYLLFNYFKFFQQKYKQKL
ncbi:MAG: DUF6146 family protein [Flavobacteriaceae bacterium]